MLHHKKLYWFLAGLTILLLAGCYKDKTVIFDTGEEITRPVGFASDIIPIFNSSCNTSGCHSAGGKSPDLTSANAYSALMNGNFVNTGDPQSSELYYWMTGKRGTPMPVSGINKDFNALVLAWIKQGAQNN
ncbi:MAG TPA: hypothetical protein VFX58_10505 [Chitinophagaceae bacterium]|nr:hypothetical protein [Chitinophagaceae bacterium]